MPWDAPCPKGEETLSLLREHFEIDECKGAKGIASLKDVWPREDERGHRYRSCAMSWDMHSRTYLAASSRNTPSLSSRVKSSPPAHGRQTN